MKKSLALLLSLIMVLSVAVFVVANEAERIPWTGGFGFHCCAQEGNPRTEVYGYEEYYNGTNNHNDVIYLIRYGNTTTWILDTNRIVCLRCDNTRWVTFSNHNGVINGHNIQTQHRGPDCPPLIECAEGSIVIADVDLVVREIIEHHRPVFRRITGTMVSYVNYAAYEGSWSGPNQTFPIGTGVNGGFHARPNGNANNMHNGFTFLQIDSAALAAVEGGVDVTIARSNQSGGNLPNPAWNTPIYDGVYTYNVRIVNGELIVTINDYRTGSWGATVTNNIANWGNNPNSAIRHQSAQTLNLGPVNGTVFMFFHMQNLTTNTITGCEVYRTETSYVPATNVDYEIVIRPVDGAPASLIFCAEGEFHYYVALYVNGEVIRVSERLTFTVTLNYEGTAFVATPETHHVDFGRIVLGSNVTVVCDICQ